jgi:hypothetical protein
MSKFNIVSLIENDTNTHLKNNYKNNLLTKIQNTFGEQEQQLFVASFYCYLKYDSAKDFVIDFKDVWEWCGFLKKANAKTLLERYFTEGVDYIVEKVADENEKAAAAIAAAAFEDSTEEKVPEKNKGGAGKNKENIFLTVDTFKYFCMKAGTKKADDIHKYYVKLEKLLHETLVEQTDELQVQLYQKQDLLEKKEQENKEQQQKIKKLENKIILKHSRVQYKERNVIYMVQDEFHKQQRVYIIGKAIDLKDRLSQYEKSRPYEVAYYRECNTAKQMAHIEKCVLMKLDKYREVSGRDRFVLPEDKDITLFTSAIDFIIDYFKDVEDREETELTEEEKKQLSRDKNREHRADNIDYLRQKDRERIKVKAIKEDETVREEDEKSVLEDNETVPKEESSEDETVREEDEKSVLEDNETVPKEESSEDETVREEEDNESVPDVVIIETREESPEEEKKRKQKERNKKYRENNLEAIREKERKYAQKHREEKIEYLKKHRQENKKEYKERDKKYYEERKEEIKKKQNKYREDHKEEIKEKKKEIVECVCGQKVRRENMYRHVKTKLHKDDLKKKTQ